MLGLQLLAEGYGARNVLERIVAARAHAEWRQLAVLDTDGQSEVYTGSRGLGVTGAAQGPDCVAAGNLLADEGVPQSMVRAFEADGSAATRRALAARAGSRRSGRRRSGTGAFGRPSGVSRPSGVANCRFAVDWSDAPIAELRACGNATRRR